MRPGFNRINLGKLVKEKLKIILITQDNYNSISKKRLYEYF